MGWGSFAILLTRDAPRAKHTLLANPLLGYSFVQGGQLPALGAKVTELRPGGLSGPRYSFVQGGQLPALEPQVTELAGIWEDQHGSAILLAREHECMHHGMLQAWLFF